MNTVYVAVGLIFYRQQVLIAKRHKNQHQGGLWEFPGGKIESSESMETALARELKEEIGLHIEAERINKFMQIPHTYKDKKVMLSVGWISINDEQYAMIEAKEGQPIKWVSENSVDEHSFPAANKSILLQLSSAFSRAN